MLTWSIRNYMYKSQKYGWLLYSGNSNSFVKLNEKLATALSNFQNTNNLEVSESDLKKLLSLGILLNETDSELLNIIRMKSFRTKCEIKQLNLTICPSNQCNFDCIYCFEDQNNRKGLMSNETVDNIINFIKEFTHIEKLKIIFYGGEPLLGIDSIKYLVSEIQKIHINVNYSIITNGYLLTKDVIEYLVRIPISSYQITIDGSEKTHNKRRPHLTNKDSYTQIIQNIDNLAQYYNGQKHSRLIIIRVNIDKTNIDEFKDVYQYFNNKYNGLVTVYSAFVDDYSCSNQNQCLITTDEQTKFHLRNYYENNIIEDSIFTSFFKFNYCFADRSDSFVIDSNGLVYKCWTDVGNVNKKIFDLKSRSRRDELLESDYFINTNPLFDEQCTKCVLLFSCFGGCPAKFIGSGYKKRSCALQKNNLQSYLDLYYEIHITNQDYTHSI